MKIVKIHVDLVKQGDLVLRDGVPKTVCGKDIKRNHFMGTSIFGDSYKLGSVPVELVTDLES